MTEEIKTHLASLLAAFDPAAPRATADHLRELWLRFEPCSVAGIKAELRQQQETAGIPVSVLREIGQGLARPARARPDDFLPLAEILWAEYGREGRAIAVIPLGAMELVEPDRIVPRLLVLCRTCITWEDADRLAMDALEPIVRRQPAEWLPRMEPWLADENKWPRRAAVTVVGRLPMKQPAYTAQCLALAGQLLLDTEPDVKKAVSFAIRLSARGEIGPVRDFLARQVPAADPAATWVLCDTIRSMTKSFLPQFAALLPAYEAWAADPRLETTDRRSVESAIKTLRQV